MRERVAERDDDEGEAFSTGRFVARLATLETEPRRRRPWLRGLVIAGTLLAMAAASGDLLAAGASVLLFAGSVLVPIAPAPRRARRRTPELARGVAAPPPPRLLPGALEELATTLAVGEGVAVLVVRPPRAVLGDLEGAIRRIAAVPLPLHAWSVGEDLVLLANPADLDERATALSRHFGDGRSGAAVGVAVGPDDGETGDLLLARARAAAQAPGGVAWHDPRTRVEVRRRTALRREAGRGLPADEVACAWLPMVDPATLRVVGAEALVRWESPRHGLVLPERFLPSLAGRGAGLDLAAQVLGEALARLAAWEESAPGFVVAVNVAGHELRDPRFLDLTGHLLDRHRVRPDRVLLELPRREVERADLALLDGMRALADRGLRLVLDRVSLRDGLEGVRDLSLSAVKMDLRPTAGEGEAWLRRRLDLLAGQAGALGLELRVSGVAGLGQLAAVRDVPAVRSAQGFALSLPLSREGVDALLVAGPVAVGDDLATLRRSPG